MAPLVKFADSTTSFEVFAREWQILESRKGTTQLQGMQIQALRSSNAEMFVPRAFRLIFAGIFGLCLIVFLVNHSSLLSHVAEMPENITGKALSKDR
jgi:hypothetical protein